MGGNKTNPNFFVTKDPFNCKNKFNGTPQCRFILNDIFFEAI